MFETKLMEVIQAMDIIGSVFNAIKLEFIYLINFTYNYVL